MLTNLSHCREFHQHQSLNGHFRETGSGTFTMVGGTILTTNVHANRIHDEVSLVDGFDLPMRITNSANCPVAECAVDLGPICR